MLMRERWDGFFIKQFAGSIVNENTFYSQFILDKNSNELILLACLYYRTTQASCSNGLRSFPDSFLCISCKRQGST